MDVSEGTRHYMLFTVTMTRMQVPGASVAEEQGHAPDMLAAHLTRLCAPSAATRYWQCSVAGWPEGPSKCTASGVN
jgi:hypothetical protein